MELRLKRVAVAEGEKIYCGPYALAALTGEPASTWVNGSMRWSTALAVLSQRMGVHDMPQAVRWSRPDWRGHRKLVGRPMLWQVCRPGRLALVSVRVPGGGHLVVLDGFLCVDNHTRRPVWVHDHPWGRARVRMLAECTPGARGLNDTVEWALAVSQ